MAKPITPPQSTFFNNQDVVAPDVDDYYTKVIKNIDSFRSRFNVLGSNITQSIALQDIDGIISDNANFSTNYQESRCNAFFRMMGFPVTNADGSDFYNPGFDPDINGNDDKINRKLNIANSALSNFKTILDNRERYSINSLTIFQPQDSSSTQAAILSIFPRSFDKQLNKDLGPFDIDNQTFNIPDRSAEIANSNELLLTPNIKSTHILKPFIVDPRIDLTITPSVNRICVPFLENKSKTQIFQSVFLKKPYLEKVALVRFKNTNATLSNGSANQFISDLTTFVKSNVNITDSSVLNVVSDLFKNYKSEIVILDKYIKIINALVIQLVDAISQIKHIKERINWQPIPDSVGGPEISSSLRDVNPSDTNNREIENNLRDQQIKKFLNETDFDIGLNNTDLGNFTFSNIDDIIFGSTKNVKQFYDQQITKLTKQRSDLGQIANNSLRTIEIITGEFSGLGLLDIIAIQAAFWAISPSALGGFFDNDVKTRVSNNTQLSHQVSIVDGNISSSLTEYEKKLSDIYVLIQAFYDAAISAGGPNTK